MLIEKNFAWNHIRREILGKGRKVLVCFRLTEILSRITLPIKELQIILLSQFFYLNTIKKKKEDN